MNSRVQAAVPMTAKPSHARETDIFVRLMIEGQTLEATFVRVDKHQLIVSLEGGLFDSSHSVCACDVELEGQSITLPTMAMSPGKNTKGAVQIVLQPDDCEESRARLWQFSRLVHTQTVLGEPCQTDPQDLPKIPARGLYSEEARQERLAFAREVTGAALEGVAQTSFDPRKLVSNIEGLIGSVEIPLGIAGPLYITGKHADGYYYAPLATSEGALVASATRGATAITRSGGARARVLEQRMLRVPMFQLQDLSQALFFADWISDHSEDIADQTARYSNYARLRQVRPQVIGRAVHVHFVYETGDAAGQNMTTTCTWQACQWIMNHMQQHHGLQFENFLVESNLSNDKKVTYQSFLNGRGIRVLAETVITARDCEQVLKVSPQQLVRAFHNLQSGGIAAGMVGSNINVANIVAAMFTATGQDIACVHESAIAHLNMEVTDQGDLYATMTLPSLVIGTVGGGTNLPQQREALELMQCAGPGNAHKLAEIIASFCLALDLSTLSAIACDQFARAHEKLGRNRPVDWLRSGELDSEFFNRQMKRDGDKGFLECQSLPSNNNGSSIITELTSHRINKFIGLHGFRLTDGRQQSLEVMTKIKPLDGEVLLMLNSMAAMCDARLAQEFNKKKGDLGFTGCHRRELQVMSQTDPRFTRHAPAVHGTLEDAEREIYLIIQEKLQQLELMDSADDISGWGQEHIEAAIRGIAEVHSIWFGKEDELLAQGWEIDVPDAEGMEDKQRLWELLGAHAREEFPEWFSDRDMELFRARVRSIGDWWKQIESLPRTLIHNDFNPRNLGFRRDATGALTLCAYDWELATLQLPQHDLAELLAFTLQDPTREQVDHYVELHRVHLQNVSGQSIDPEQWRLGYRLSLNDLTVNRLPLYLMAHTFRDYKFMPRVAGTFRSLLQLEGFGV